MIVLPFFNLCFFLVDLPGLFNVHPCTHKSPNISHEHFWDLLFGSLWHFYLFSIQTVSQLGVGGTGGAQVTRDLPQRRPHWGLLPRKFDMRQTSFTLHRAAEGAEWSNCDPTWCWILHHKPQFSNKMTACDINECQWGGSRILTSLSAGFI